MTTDDVKLTILNTAVLFISFSNVENILKILLLIVSIVYTIFKAIDLYKTKIKKQNGPGNNQKNTDITSKD